MQTIKLNALAHYKNQNEFEPPILSTDSFNEDMQCKNNQKIVLSNTPLREKNIQIKETPSFNESIITKNSSVPHVNNTLATISKIETKASFDDSKHGKISLLWH